MYQHPRRNIQSFFQAGCKSLYVGFAAVSHLTLAMRETILLLQECSRLWSYRGGTTKHPWQCLVFTHKPELTPLKSPTFLRAEIIPILDIPRRDEPNLPREHTCVHHSPTSFQKSQCSEHHMVSSYLVGNTEISTIKYLIQICQSYLHIFPTVLSYI